MQQSVEQLQSTEIKTLIGSVLHTSKAILLSGSYVQDIRVLLEQRGVLVIPQVGFTQEELICFTQTLGRYVADKADGGATAISLDESSSSAEYTKSSCFWHFDGYMNQVPVLASILSAEVISPTGGNTEFCNTYAAYEALPEGRKQQLEGLSAVHALAAAQLSVTPEPDYQTFEQWLQVPRNTLPLVWTHRSGRRSLVIGNTAANIIGLDPLEGLELLIWLREWATQERFRYSHQWSVGDAVIWDNTGTLHRVTPYAIDSGRLLYRTKLEGEEPFA